MKYLTIRYVWFIPLSYVFWLSHANAFPTSPEYPTYKNRVQCYEAVYKRYHMNVQDALENYGGESHPALLEAATQIHRHEQHVCEKTYQS